MAKIRAPKVTRLINALIASGYFNTPRSLSDITETIVEQSGEVFYSNQVSGIVLVMVKEGKLSRAISEKNKQYDYFNP